MSFLQGAGRRTAALIGRESRFIRSLRPTYESILNWSGNGIPWSINGVTYRIDPHQRHRLGQNYDAPVAAFLRERVQPGSICFDVGANVGVYVLQFAFWSGPTGRVVAFEPNPEAVRILKRHVEMNGLEDRVTIVDSAMGASRGVATLFASEADGMSRMGEPNVAIADRISEVTVLVTTLDEYCRSALKPNWLLMDIEGFEIAALSGGRETIQCLGKDLNMVVEMHPDVWNSASTTRSEAEDLLSELGLRPEALTGQSDPLTEHGLVYLAHIA